MDAPVRAVRNPRSTYVSYAQWTQLSGAGRIHDLSAGLMGDACAPSLFGVGLALVAAVTVHC